MLSKYSSLLVILILTISYCYGQNASILGSLHSEDGVELPGVYLKLSNGLSAITDEHGTFLLKNIAPGHYVLETSFIGFQAFKQGVNLSAGQKLKLDLVLQEEVKQLEEVVIAGETEAMALKKSVSSVALVEAKPFYNRSLNTPDLLNTISGVQVRQSGGVGNSAEISIQGLSGRQVKLFIDGIPMDFLLPVEELGVGSALSMFPVNLMERMEVYKGAVPVELGADALGGAINIVTRKSFHDYLEFTTERSSFNTLRSSISARKVFKSGFNFGVGAFYLASDNSYNIDDVKLINDFGNPESISAKKFHDRFRSYLVKGDLGVVNTAWADQLSLNFSYGDLYDEIQHNFEMRQPYGQALNLSTTYNTSLHYEKYQIANKLDADVYLGYNLIQTHFVDTTRNIYNWRGEVIGQKSYGGEITTSQNDLSLEGKNITGRLLLNYKLTPGAKLTFNTVLTHFKRSGKDPVAAQYYGEDYFQNPVYMDKLVAGLGFEKQFLSDRITSNTAIKAYTYNSEGFLIEDGDANTTMQDYFQPGFSQSLKWVINLRWLAKFSYEYATRMPDRVEALGDFSSAINANPSLKPETSHNLNLGTFYQMKKWKFELNGFYRDVNDIIILQAVPPPVLSKYENLLKAKISGVEGEVQYQPWKWVTIRANATYQDLRNRSSKGNAGVSNDRYYGARLPNKPYLFGNGEVQLQKEGLIQKGDQIQAWWTTAYVKEFFRYWEIDGRKEDKLTVPNQWLHNLGLSYTLKGEQLTLSLESQNLFNAQAYDNFRVQKPGRSWHVKMRFFITKP